MLCLCATRTILSSDQFAKKRKKGCSWRTSVDAVQPSGNIQPLGLDPWTRDGYGVMNRSLMDGSCATRCIYLDRETVPWTHHPRLFIDCISLEWGKEVFSRNKCHVRVWIIHGGLWNAVPMPWPVNSGDIENPYLSATFVMALPMPWKGRSGPHAFIPISRASRVAFTNRLPCSSWMKQRYPRGTRKGE